MLESPEYKICSRRIDGGCKGRITLEHAIIFAGKQVNSKWAIIPLCEYHHAVNTYQDGGDLDKDINKCIALNRATDAELDMISKVIDYKKERERLNEKYRGIYK